MTERGNSLGPALCINKIGHEKTVPNCFQIFILDLGVRIWIRIFPFSNLRIRFRNPAQNSLALRISHDFSRQKT